MITKPIAAHFIQHDSEPTHYAHPYLFTHETEYSGEVYVWSSHDNSLYSTLDEPMADPKEHHLISKDYLLSLTTATGDYDLSEILIHNLPEGDIIDRMRLGPVDSSGLNGNSKFLGVFEGKIAVWRNEGANGGNGVIEIYLLSNDGKLKLSDTLLSPPGGTRLESDNLPGTYFPPEMIHISQHEFVGVYATQDDFPSGIGVTRYASSANATRQKQITFNFSTTTLPYPNADMQTSLRGHLYIQKHDSFILAHNEYPLEDSDPNPITTIRCLDFDTLELKWCVTLQSDTTCKLRYIPDLDVVICLGDGSTSFRTEEGILKKIISHLSITILDPSTGHIRASHALRDPERPCGNVMWREMGSVCCDLTPTGEDIVIIFGDGQLAAIPVKQLLGSVPSKLENIIVNGKVVTTECPAIEPSVPSSEEQRKDLQEGRWRWVKRGFVGDKVAILHLLRDKGFASLSWK